MGEIIDEKPIAGKEHGANELEKATSQIGHHHDLDLMAKASEYKADAIEAENAEHNMGVLEAMRAYPMASFWAFIMSFCIVSSLSLFRCRAKPVAKTPKAAPADMTD